MAMLTIRNLSDSVVRALRAQATEHGRSFEAEVLAILESAVKPATSLKIGSALSALGRQTGLTNQDLDDLEQSCAKTRKLIELAGSLTRPGGLGAAVNGTQRPRPTTHPRRT